MGQLGADLYQNKPLVAGVVVTSVSLAVAPEITGTVVVYAIEEGGATTIMYAGVDYPNVGKEAADIGLDFVGVYDSCF